MYPHHEQSIRNLSKYLEGNPDILAVILGGSVAKGTARPDSDIDAIVVVKDGMYRTLCEENRLSECIGGYCTYDGGYFDIKYCDLAYIRAVSKRGSEPARVSFEGSVSVFCRNPEIDLLLPQISVFQKSEKPDKLLAFYSALELNQDYFWSVSDRNQFLRARVITDIVLFGLRLLLQDKEVLFPCNKGLEATVAQVDNGHDALECARRLMSDPNTENKDAFVQAVMSSINYTPPADYTVPLTNYINNHELWWYKDSPVISEW